MPARRGAEPAALARAPRASARSARRHGRGVVARHEHARLAVDDDVGHAADGARDDGHAGARGFEQRDAQALRAPAGCASRSRPGTSAGRSARKPASTTWPAKPRSASSARSRRSSGPRPKHSTRSCGHSRDELGQQREQPRVALALDELRDDADDERVGGQSERGAQPLARRRVGAVALRVDGARDQRRCARARRPRRASCRSIARDNATTARYGRYLSRASTRRLRRVDAPRQHGRERRRAPPRSRRRDPRRGASARARGRASGASARATSRGSSMTSSSPRIGSATTSAAARRGAELAAWRAEQHVVDAAARQSFEEVAGLGPRRRTDAGRPRCARCASRDHTRRPLIGFALTAARAQLRGGTSSERTISVMRWTFA